MKYYGWIKTSYNYSVEADNEGDAKEQVCQVIRENLLPEEIDVESAEDCDEET